MVAVEAHQWVMTGPVKFAQAVLQEIVSVPDTFLHGDAPLTASGR